jgi:hypothetical protein
MNNLCRVSIEESAHDRPAGKYQRAIAEKTQELLEGRFNPMSDDNFSCFFSADLSHQQMHFLLLVRDELRKGDFQLAGRMLERAVIEFYSGLARQEAVDQIDNADCGNCFDQGCHNCMEMEVE